MIQETMNANNSEKETGKLRREKVLREGCENSVTGAFQQTDDCKKQVKKQSKQVKTKEKERIQSIENRQTSLALKKKMASNGQKRSEIKTRKRFTCLLFGI